METFESGIATYDLTIAELEADFVAYYKEGRAK